MLQKLPMLGDCQMSNSTESFWAIVGVSGCHHGIIKNDWDFLCWENVYELLTKLGKWREK